MAEKYVWSDSYSVGSDLIDAQHKKFFALANRLLTTAAKAHVTYEEVEEHVMALSSYAYYHLATEDQYLLQAECPGGMRHVEIHNAFRAEAMRHVEDLRAPSVDYGGLATELADFAGSWLANHILTVDKKSAECFKLPLPKGHD